MNVAFIGLGMVAETHMRAIADIGPDLVLTGVCSRDPANAAAFAEKMSPILGAPPQVYDTVAEIAADDRVDFVILCTPPNARLEIVKTLAQAGKPILMEKPIERDTKAATQIVETCEAANVPLGIVFQHRMRESSQQLHDLLASGRLGKVAAAEIAIPWWRDQAYYDEPGRGTYARDGGGVLISQAIHTLDVALWLLGSVTKVQAVARTTQLHNMESEDFVTAGLDFASGAVGSLVASTASFPGTPESIALHCTHGSVVLASGQLQVTWRNGETQTFGEAGGTGGGADPMAFTHAWHQAVITDFMSAIPENRPPAASGRSALDVHRLIDAVIQSSHEERSVIVS
jgi:predicted dehydrogenase